MAGRRRVAPPAVAADSVDCCCSICCRACCSCTARSSASARWTVASSRSFFSRSSRAVASLEGRLPLNIWVTRVRGEVLIKEAPQRRLRLITDERVYRSPLNKEHHKGDALHLHSHGDLLGVIYVDLSEDKATGVLISEALKDGA